jgi:hypothetical protein
MKRLIIALALFLALLPVAAAADSGVHMYTYCQNGILYRRMVWAQWVAPDYHNFDWHHHVQSAGNPVVINVCY